jgi:hypothetical protein
VAQDENALALLIGGQLPADLPPPQPFANSSYVAELPAGVPSTLMEQRPDIMAAEHQLKGGQCQHRRGAGGLLPADFADGHRRRGQHGARLAVHGRHGLGVRAADHTADF